MLEEDQIHALNWVSIPGDPYIIKYVFHDSGYHVMVSDLTSLYSEKLADTDIQERFCSLNPYAQMKSVVILENLKKSLEKCLTEESDHSIKCDSNKLVFTLKFPAAYVSCSYTIEMDLMASNKVMHFVIGPTILGALLSQRKVLELQKRILSIESNKSSASSNMSALSQDLIDPEWLNGQNIPVDFILDSFIKLQSHFKELYVESKKTSPSKKEKLKGGTSDQAHKKCKIQDYISDESVMNTMKCEETEEGISIKKEQIEYMEAPLSQSQKNGKKKKVFKI